MKRHLRPAAVLPAVFMLALAGCEASKSSNPLSPSVAGPIAGVTITQPKLLEPAQGFKFKESQQPIKLLIENASSTGVRPLSYAFEVASDSDFANKVYARSGVPEGEGGRTSVIIERLELGRVYYWRARAEDGANNGQYSTASFDVLPRAFLNPPPQVSPINGATASSRRPSFVAGRPDRNEAVGSVTYEFQVATDAAFGSVVADGRVDEEGDSTSFTPGGDLAASTQHFWRVRAFDNETDSGWSGAQGFRTPAASGPGPSPNPGPAPGGPCDSSNPDEIVRCERNKYSGWMDPGQIVEFLKSTARSLNRNNIGGGPWGILRKEGGNQCGGYSCDIICSGQGTSQKQVDVLSDVENTQGAGWGATHTWPGIRIDVCEIQ
jgi:hypothetical protein